MVILTRGTFFGVRRTTHQVLRGIRELHPRRAVRAAAGAVADGVRATVAPLILLTIILLLVGIIAAMLSVATAHALTTFSVRFLPEQVGVAGGWGG